MAELETLTQEERYEIIEKATREELKLLRIHDSQVERICYLEARLAKSRQRIDELELQVLVAPNVSRPEYEAMVKQRDEMRQERNDARGENDGLRESLGFVLDDLSALRARPGAHWRLGEAIWTLECALRQEGLSDLLPSIEAASPTPLPPKEILDLIMGGIEQAMVTLMNIERLGDLPRIYAALDAIEDHLLDLIGPRNPAPA